MDPVEFEAMMANSDLIKRALFEDLTEEEWTSVRMGDLYYEVYPDYMLDHIN